MLRTRDLILFIFTIFFLVIAITATLASNASTASINLVAFNQATNTSNFEVSTPEVGLDRQSVIARLRARLQDSTERIEPSPSVEAPVVAEVPVEEEVGLQRCLYPDDALAMVPRWPLANVSVKVQEGARSVFVSETVVVPSAPSETASSTQDEEVVTTVVSLIQLPAFPVKLADVSCIPSEVVGVTNGGILMFNGDVNSYRKIPESALIGYARDGFPIYGVYEGAVDQCGGYDHPSGYRYTISTERDYILGCYVGSPASFSF
jgi:hypothetical protein